MSVVDELFNKNHRVQLVVAVVLALYIVGGVGMPAELGKHVNTSFGHIAIIVIALVFFVRVNLVLGIIIIIAAYEVIRRAHPSNVKRPTTSHYPLLQETFSSGTPVGSAPVIPAAERSETDKKTAHMRSMQPHHDADLETEMVAKMTSFTSREAAPSWPTYVPVQCGAEDAAPIS